MKVCLLSTSFPVTPDLISGVFIHQLARQISTKCQLTVVTPAYTVPTRVSDGENYKLVSFSYAPSKWQRLAHTEGGIPAALRKDWYSLFLVPPFLLSMLLTTLTMSRKCDVLHANWSICGAIAGIAGKLLGIPVLTTIRGSDLERAKSSWIDRIILRSAVSTNQALVVVNPSQQQALTDIAPLAKSKLHTIVNGIGEEFYAVGKGRAPRINSYRILTISRLIESKGIATILHALKLTDSKEFTLTIVGSGPEKGKLKRLASDLDINHLVYFAGSVAHLDIPKVFENHDIFVLASQAEGRPNVVIEAVATCTPVICTQIPGIHGLIVPGTTGRTFPVGNADALAQQLNDARNNPQETYNMSRKAMTSLINSGQTWEKCAEAYISLYRGVAGKQ